MGKEADGRPIEEVNGEQRIAHPGGVANVEGGRSIGRCEIMMKWKLAAGVSVSVLLAIIVWQQIQLIRHRADRQPGRVIRLSSDLKVFDVIEGSNVFTIPKGMRIQESTPCGLSQPLERGGKEYIVVLRTSGGPRGPVTLTSDPEWMDDYHVESPESE
jgi:hypothetical protein